MVGDGFNDVGVFVMVYVFLVLGGVMDVFQLVLDVVYFGGLFFILNVFNIVKWIKCVMVQNFGFVVVYNFVVVLIVVIGYVMLLIVVIVMLVLLLIVMLNVLWLNWGCIE